jgi:CheY-like chemotaxis protein
MPSEQESFPTHTSGLLRRIQGALSLQKQQWSKSGYVSGGASGQSIDQLPVLTPCRRRTAENIYEDRTFAPLESIRLVDGSAESLLPLQNCTVLLVDDNAINQVVGARMLISLGCRVYVAHDGDDAIRQICVCAGIPPPSDSSLEPTIALRKMVRSKSLSAIEFRRAVAPDPIDVVLMDYQMPIKDGMAATREIREMERMGKFTCASPSSCGHGHFGKKWNSRLSVIAATTLEGEDVQRAFVDAGVDGFTKKPFAAETLRETLERIMKPPKDLGA